MIDKGSPVGRSFVVRDVGLVKCVAVSRNGQTLYVRHQNGAITAIKVNQVLAEEGEMSMANLANIDVLAAWNTT